MNCQEFERLWNERLDTRGAFAPELEHALDSHAAGCTDCRVVAARYRLLRQALAALAPPTPPAGFASRCLAVPERAPWRWSRFAPARAGVRLAVAAALVWGVLIGLWSITPHEKTQIGGRPQQEPGLLTDALAEATSATWELAVETSGPAARIGRDVLDVAVSDASSDIASDAPSAANAASDVFHSVGQRVGEGVKPLSGSARHAFGFLLGPALTEEPETARPS
jgi:hypothetical protein